MQERQLFSEFQGLSKEDWYARIEKDLKGKKPEELFKQWQDIQINPFRDRSDSFKSSSFFRRNEEWLIRQSFCVENAKSSNAAILNALNEGVNNLELSGIESADLLEQCLKSVNLSFVRSDLKLGAWLMKGGKEAFESLTEDRDISGSWNFDPLGELYRTRSFYSSPEDDFQFIFTLEQKPSLANFSWIEVSGVDIHNEGAYASTELAIMLAMFNEYLGALSNPKAAANKVVFKLGLGVNYMLELSKIRSFRRLASSVASEYGYTGDLFISAETGLWNLTAQDRHSNLLRSTTEAMAAAIGGADAISILPFDVSLKTDHHSAKHLARMQQELLANESFLNKVVDPAEGSYFLESLSAELERISWKKFQEIESKGGFIKAHSEGLIEEMVLADRQEQERAFDEGTLKVLGVNSYPNKEEKLPAEIEESQDRLSKRMEKEVKHV